MYVINAEVVINSTGASLVIELISGAKAYSVSGSMITPLPTDHASIIYRLRAWQRSHWSACRPAESQFVLRSTGMST